MATDVGAPASTPTDRVAKSAAAAAWKFLNDKGKSTTRHFALSIPSWRKKPMKGADTKANPSQPGRGEAPRPADSKVVPVTHVVGNVFAPQPACGEQADSAFLRLPPEIRIRIYQEYFDNTMLFLVGRHKKIANSMVQETRLETRMENIQASKRRISMLLTCRRVYLDTVDVLFSKTIFNLNEPDVVHRLPTILPNRVDRGFNGIRTISTMCYVDSEGLSSFENACSLFASLPCLRSLSIDVAPSTFEYDKLLRRLETNRNSGVSDAYYSEDSFIVKLESTIRSHVGRIQQVKSICIWFQWPRYPQSLALLPSSCRIHRRYRAFGGFQSTEEDHTGNLIDCPQPCTRCTFD